MSELPEYMTDTEMKRHADVGPKVELLVLADGKVYRKEGGQWRQLDYRPTEGKA